MIPGLTNRHIAITARIGGTLSPRCPWACVAQLTWRCPARTVRRRLGPSHLQPPQRLCSSCAAIVENFGVCEYVYVRASALFGLLVVDRSAFVPCCMRFLCFPFAPPWIELCMCLCACPLTWSVSAHACLSARFCFTNRIAQVVPSSFLSDNLDTVDVSRNVLEAGGEFGVRRGGV